MTAASSPSFIPISAPSFGEEEERLVLEVLRSGMIAQGPKVAHFESLCAEMAGTTQAIALSNGTVALEAALEVLGIGPGDEVITTPFTFAATLNAILRRGATARFADITGDYTIDPESTRLLLTPRTRALLPVHLYGLMADMASISAIAAAHGVYIIEDAAQAHGATLGDRLAGSYGLGCFSFYATKNVTSGEGGVVTISDEEVAERLRVLRNQGMRSRYDYVMVGQNWRMTDLAAAVAIPQMQRLRETTTRRNHNAAILTQLLARASQVVTPAVPAGRGHVWHQYTVLLPAAADREAVIDGLTRRGVGSGVYYPRLVWDYPPYRDHPQVVADATPRATEIARRCLSLPVHPGLTEAELERVARALLDSLDRVTK